MLYYDSEDWLAAVQTLPAHEITLKLTVKWTTSEGRARKIYESTQNT